jgi:hypothetical protein
MTVVGVDLNATRVRAVSGPADGVPQTVLLDGTEPELPLALSLEQKRPVVGRAGVALCREYPHLACHDFLAALGSSRTWAVGRHRLDSGKALLLVFDYLRPLLTPATGLTVVLPSYLSEAQAAQVVGLAQKAKLPANAAVAAPLAIARGAYGEEPWSGTAVLVDADDHASIWTVLQADQQQIGIVKGGALPELGLRIWKECLLNAIAGWCIRHSRRDPRDSGSAEQLLFDQLNDVLQASQDDQLVEVVIQTATWCQNLILQPEQVRGFCASLVDQAVDEIGCAFGNGVTDGVAVLLVTPSAARLPGLVPALAETMGLRIPVRLLSADAAARTAHQLAATRDLGSGAPRDFIATSIPMAKTARAASSAAGQTRSRLAFDR